jgi:HAD superfamily hydrolase (TIGR01509 family)
VLTVPVETVLFDWDGTLWDSAPASLRAFQRMFGEFGIELTAERHDELYAPDWYTMYEALGLPRDVWSQADRRWMEHYEREEPELIAGAAAAVETLRARGLAMGVVSSGSRARIVRELERSGLARAFDALVANEDVVERKPHPEGLLRALAALNRTAASCCYVGDAPADIVAARAAGMVAIGVGSRYVSAGRLAACGPDVMLGEIGDLPDVVCPK